MWLNNPGDREVKKRSILNMYDNINIHFFSRTREHEVKYQRRLDIRKYSFSQRTTNEWNRLSTYCITASSVNMFKNKVDTYPRRACYT